MEGAFKRRGAQSSRSRRKRKGHHYDWRPERKNDWLLPKKQLLVGTEQLTGQTERLVDARLSGKPL